VPAGAEVVVSGIRDVETGRVIADRVRFSANELEPGEARLWRSLAAERTAQELTSGQLRIPTVGTYTLLADEDIQARVGRIGGRLIPAYQRDLPGDDPRKIPFQFHVVASRSVNAFATPNGIVVIHRGLLDLLQNDAQLAAVLAHEIVHATHEHTWRERKHQRIPRIAVGAAGVVAAVFGVSSGLDLALMVNTALISRHARALENQADRVSLYYMAQAGYEPREAPRVWEILRAHLGDRKADPLWGSYESQSRRRAQLLQELAYNHRQ
jgi:predicted Zn-dependent protease